MNKYVYGWGQEERKRTRDVSEQWKLMVVSPYENQLGAIGHNHNSMGWNIEKS